MSGQIYKVRRPDGEIVPLTCTEEQLNEVWIPEGYAVVTEDAAIVEPAEEAIEEPVSDDKSKRPR